MPPSHTTAMDTPDDCPPRDVAGWLRRTYRTRRDRVVHSLRLFCLNRAGSHGFGRLAARLAAWGTAPYHGRAGLASWTPRGFIAPTASVSHPGLRLGKHVYLGDNVVLTRCDGGGPLRLEDSVHLYGDTFVETGRGASLSIGEGTHIQPGCHLHAHVGGIRIGKRVEIAAGCGFYSYNHGMEPGRPIMDQPLESEGGISIGDGAWLGYRVTVLQNVTIGAGAVIAAGAVVARDIPENAIAAGVPARVIKFRGPADFRHQEPPKSPGSACSPPHTHP